MTCCFELGTEGLLTANYLTYGKFLDSCSVDRLPGQSVVVVVTIDVMNSIHDLVLSLMIQLEGCGRMPFLVAPG
jgi:hypothetical protein